MSNTDDEELPMSRAEPLLHYTHAELQGLLNAAWHKAINGAAELVSYESRGQSHLPRLIRALKSPYEEK